MSTDKDTKNTNGKSTPVANGTAAAGATLGVKVAVVAASPAVAGLPWVEKYRPGDLSSVKGNEEAVKRLRLIAEHGNMPNMILSGPPGTGKTTSVLCLARELLLPHLTGSMKLKDVVLELNASDARGIDVVRGKIRQFAQKKTTLPANRQKIVILDEADAMTEQAQHGLRRLMDKFCATTRFALACNTVKKIIDSLQSRCVSLRFLPLSDAEVQSRTLEIARQERIPDKNMTADGVGALLFTAQGDLRQAINNLQAVSNGLGLVNAENVYKIADQPPPTLLTAVLTSCVKGDAKAAANKLSQIWKMGYAGIDIVSTLHKVCISSNNMEPRAKQRFVLEISKMHVRVSAGLSSLLQLHGLVATLSSFENGNVTS